MFNNEGVGLEISISGFIFAEINVKVAASVSA
jgi:hypothetical protein